MAATTAAAAAVCCSSRLDVPRVARPRCPRRRRVVAARASSRPSPSPAPALATDSYSMLGIRPGDSKQELKRAYRRLALQYHPDVCKGDHCAPKFQQINAAYELLQKMMDSSASASATPVDGRYYYYYDDDDDEEDLEQYKSGWEGAWVL